MRYLIIILWLLLGLFYWWVSKQCCSIGDTATSAVPAVVPDGPCPASTAYSYNWGSNSPVLASSTNWDSLRASLLKGVKPNQILQITGMYRAEEQNSTTYDNLGLARANNFIKLLKLDPKTVRLTANKANMGKRDKNCGFAGVSTKAMVNSKNVIEEEVKDEFGNVSTKTTIYFPFNSTNKLNDSEVESYLNDVAKRVKSTGEKVQLVGHTDNVGGDGPNIALGQRRADIVKNYLIKRGVSPSKILASSKGETSPIASNDSDNGRAKNRRTELRIIK